MDKQVHSVASDFLRGALIQFAMRKAAELAREGFYLGLGSGDVGNEDLALFAEEAWGKYTLSISFDYPRYAHTLFLQAYRMAYHAYSRELPKGLHPNLQELVEEFESESGLTPETSRQS
jgi:hypothetical protein